MFYAWLVVRGNQLRHVNNPISNREQLVGTQKGRAMILTARLSGKYGTTPMQINYFGDKKERLWMRVQVSSGTGGNRFILKLGNKERMVKQTFLTLKFSLQVAWGEDSLR